MAPKAPVSLIIFCFGLAFVAIDKCSAKIETCGPGQYLIKEPEVACLSCLPKTFNSDVKHKNEFCRLCTQPHVNFGDKMCNFTVIPCTGDVDTIIQCHPGCYLGYGRDECLPCSNCTHRADKYIGRECQGNNDTICCPSPNMTVELQQKHFQCVADVSNKTAANYTDTSFQELTTDGPQITSAGYNTTDHSIPTDNGSMWIIILSVVLAVLFILIMLLIYFFRSQVRNPIERLKKMFGQRKTNFSPIKQNDEHENNHL